MLKFQGPAGSKLLKLQQRDQVIMYGTSCLPVTLLEIKREWSTRGCFYVLVSQDGVQQAGRLCLALAKRQTM